MQVPLRMKRWPDTRPSLGLWKFRGSWSKGWDGPASWPRRPLNGASGPFPRSPRQILTRHVYLWRSELRTLRDMRPQLSLSLFVDCFQEVVEPSCHPSNNETPPRKERQDAYEASAFTSYI